MNLIGEVCKTDVASKLFANDRHGRVRLSERMCSSVRITVGVRVNHEHDSQLHRVGEERTKISLGVGRNGGSDLSLICPCLVGGGNK